MDRKARQAQRDRGEPAARPQAARSQASAPRSAGDRSRRTPPSGSLDRGCRRAGPSPAHGQPVEDVARHGALAFSPPRPRRCPHGEPDRRAKGRMGLQVPSSGERVVPFLAAEASDLITPQAAGCARALRQDRSRSRPPRRDRIRSERSHGAPRSRSRQGQKVGSDLNDARLLPPRRRLDRRKVQVVRHHHMVVRARPLHQRVVG